MERKIGAQMYTIRDYTQNEADIETSINKLVKIGYTFGQASGMCDIAPEKLKEICDKAGYKITGSHCKWDALVDDTDKVIADHKIFGCMMPGIGGLPVPARESKDGIVDFMNKANTVADKMAANGMTFTYHNHAFEFVNVDGKKIMDYILDMASENFKLMVDVYWLSVAGINPTKFLRKYKDMIGGIHYKDLKVVNNAPAMCEIGDGNLEWDEISAVCDEIKPRFIYVEQDTNWMVDPFTSLDTSYNNLKKLGYK